MCESALLGWDHRASCTTEASHRTRRTCLSRPPEGAAAQNRRFQRTGHMAAFRPHHADVAVQVFGRRLQLQCAQNETSPCAQNDQHVPGHSDVRADEFTKSRTVASTCAAPSCVSWPCASARKGCRRQVGAAHTQTPQASTSTRGWHMHGRHTATTSPAHDQHGAAVFDTSAPFLRLPHALQVLGCHLADRLGMTNPPRRPSPLSSCQTRIPDRGLRDQQ